MQTGDDFVAALRGGGAELILADHLLPGFDGLMALDLAQEVCPQTPFLFVTGTMDDKLVIEAFRRGAHDCVLKQHPESLVPAVERALRAAAERTGRAEAEAKLRASEELLRRVMESSHDCIKLLDLEGRLLWMNACGLRVMELDSFAPLRNVPWLEFWQGQDYAAACAAVQAAKGRGVGTFTGFCPTTKGTAKWWDVVVTPVLDAAGQPEKLLSISRDVTERRAGEEAVRSSAALYASLVESLPQSIFRKDAAGRFTFANRRLCLTLGLTVADLLGKTDAELFAPELAAKYRADDLRVLATGLPYEAEEEVQGAEGKVRHVQVNKSALLDAAGAVIGVQGVFLDVTERRELEAQFLRAQRLESLGALACGVAHDLNNILAPIMMAAPMLRMGLPPDEVAALSKTMEQSVERGAGVVKQLLTFGRGVEGERGLLQARHLLREIAHIAKETFPKSISVAAEVPSDLWPLQGDATHIHQVLMNLAVNARDAMPQGGTLTMQAENVRLDANYAMLHRDAHAGTYVRIKVTDTGSGIPKAIQERIFDPFFSTKAPGKGTGLGLSTTLGIVKSHGGFIHLYSEVGQGTAFSIYLPAVEGGEAIEAAPVAAPLAQGSGETILVVDDEAGFLMAAKQILALHGFYMLSAADGVEALSVFTQNQAAIKVVLTDVQMPVMDGVTLARVLQKLAPGIKVIASSGLDDSPQLAELREMGVTHFLGKPYSVAQLLAQLKELLHPPAGPTSAAK